MSKKKKIAVLNIIIISVIIGIFSIKPYYHRYKVKKNLYKKYDIVNIKDNSFESLKLLDSDLNSNEIFLAGETHGSIKSIEMNLYLLKYFVEEAGVKYILYEGGYSTAKYLNEYLETGDENIIKYLFDNLRKTSSYTNENYNLLKNIYKYNQTLPQDKKVEFVGIDKEIPLVAIKYIKSLFPKIESNNKDVRMFISTINSMGKNNYVNESKKAIEIMNKSKEEIEEYLGENFFDISYVLNNLSVSEGQVYREDLLIDNFIKLYENLPKNKYFGQLGSNHTNLNPNTKSLASYLQTSYFNTKNKVISIEYSYKNSSCYIPVGLNIDSKIEAILDEDIFPSNGETVIMKLNYENSIYNEKDIFLNSGFRQLDYYQYLILFSNSMSASRYE